MSEQLVKIDIPEENALTKKLMGSGGKFLPRVQFMSSNSQKCKEGEFPVNNFALIDNNNHIDLGKKVDVILLGMRPKALDTQTPLTCYEPNLDEDGEFTGDFQDIVERSKVKDSGCMWGPEFLVYIPANKQFATFFMGTVTMRYEDPKLQSNLGNAMTLGSKLIETKSYSYMSPVGMECSTVVEVPDADEMAKAMEQFNNPPKPESERADDAEAEATERVQ
jgi:hypothetical protein